MTSRLHAFTLWPAIALLAASALLFSSCSSGQSPVITALEVVSVAADVGAPVLAQLDPKGTQFFNLLPGVLTDALNVAQGVTPIAGATSALADLQNLWAQGEALLSSLAGTQKALIASVLAALNDGIQLFQQQYGTAPTVTGSLAARGYALGFLDSPNPHTAKAKKLSKKDREAIAAARAHLAALQAKLAAKK